MLPQGDDGAMPSRGVGGAMPLVANSDGVMPLVANSDVVTPFRGSSGVIRLGADGGGAMPSPS
jgi:hypothetical protein